MNEEKSLNFIEEIVVVDTGSSDDSIKIAEKYTTIVYDGKYEFSDINVEYV